LNVFPMRETALLHMKFRKNLTSHPQRLRLNIALGLGIFWTCSGVKLVGL